MEGEIATLLEQMKLLFEQKQQQAEEQQQMLGQLKSSLEEKMEASYQGIKDLLDKQLQMVKNDLEAQVRDSRKRIDKVDEKLGSLDYKVFKTVSKTQDALAELEMANRYENEDIYKGLQELEMQLQVVKEECQPTRGASGFLRSQQPASVRKKTTRMDFPTLWDTWEGFQTQGQAVAGDVSQKLTPYNGKTPLEAYLSEFETISQIYGWDEKQRGGFLAASLSGPARDILECLPSEKRQSYPDLVKALIRQFGAVHQAELARAHFRSRRKKKEESFPEFAEDLRNLAGIAFWEASKETQDLVAKDQFLDGQSDMEVRKKVRELRPKTLHEAVEFTKEIKAFIAETSKSGRDSLLKEALAGIEADDEEEEQEEEKPDPFLRFFTDKKDPPKVEELGACAKP